MLGTDTIKKQVKAEIVAREALAAANKGNPFVSKSEAMQLINIVRHNSKQIIAGSLVA